MYRIGEFSQLAKVTVKTLRFYDSEGLLTPCAVDEWTKYRYYSTAQLIDLQKIVSYRQVGLSIEEIKSIFNGEDALSILSKKEVQLREEEKEVSVRLKSVVKMIHNLKENKTMKYQAILKDVPSYKVFKATGVVKCYEDLAPFIVGVGEECLKANPTLKCEELDYCYVTYLDEEYRDHDMNVLYVQAVESAGVDTERVHFDTLPAVKVVSVMVAGSYQNFPSAYSFILDWIQTNGYQMAEKPREVYIDGCWNQTDENNYLSEIQIPIK